MTEPTESHQDELAGIRERIAVQIWGFPVKHSWLTLEDAKTYPGWQRQVEECYEEADQILSLTVSSGGICPECKGEKVINIEITPWKANVEDCPTCKGTGQKPIVTKTVGEIIKEALK